MEEGIKNRVILILGILTIIFFIGTAGSCSNLRQLRLSRDKEIATRLDVEERMGKVMQQMQGYEERLNKLNAELESEKTTYTQTKKALEQERLVNQGLKEELEKVTKLKEALEEDLKEALVVDKSKKTKKR